MNVQAPPDTWQNHWGRADRLGLETDRIPVSAYTSPETFAAECEKIFKPAWLMTARVEEVPDPGDFIRRQIPPLRADILITRDRHGELHAFHNACVHRGTAVETDSQGCRKAFSCPYHAWTYELDGSLRGIPGRDCFPQVDIAKTRLKPVHMATWNGFIFLNLSDEPRQSLAEYLGEFATSFADMPFGEYRQMTEMVRDVPANWKAFVEASNEGYHVAALHRQSLSERVTTKGNPLNHFCDPVFSGPHVSATVEARTDWMPEKPVSRFVMDCALARASASESGGADATPFTAHPAVNRANRPGVSAECMVIFPFTCIQMMPNSYVWFQYWPVAHDLTHFVWRQYSAAPPSSYREAFCQAYGAAFARDIVTEDCTMVATQGRNFAGGGVSEVLFGENEYILRHFHGKVQECLNGS